MPQNLRATRRKIRTVQNIHKITRAMKMVAAAKLRRVQAGVDNGRRYWDLLDRMIGHVASSAGEFTHPLLQVSECQAPVAVVVIGGARGLCGSYNVSLLRTAQDFIERRRAGAKVITVGGKAWQFARREGWDIMDQFNSPDEEHRLFLAREISRVARDHFLAGEVSAVHVVYTQFYSAIRHIPTVRQFLPIPPTEANDNGNGAGVSYIFEPPADELLASLLPRALDSAMYEMLLMSAAAEEGARMTSMSAATDNAEEMITSLTREANRIRQTQITTEILEVVSGAEALTSE